MVDDTLPTATGGDGALSYSLEGRLPPGLRFSSSSRKITGIPTGPQAATVYTYRATDADGDKASLSFSITVEEAARSSPPSGDGDGSLRPFLDLSLFTQCCIYEERGRQQFSMRVDLAQPQTERVQVNVSYDLGETADDFESFHVQAFGITARTTSAGIIVTATPRDDDIEEPEKYLTVTASATIAGETYTDTQVLKLIDNDAPEPVVVDPLSVSGDGTVTWERGKKRTRGQLYLLRWVSGESPPESADNKNAPGYGRAWIEERDCDKKGCEFQIPDFNPALHYLVQVRSVFGKGDKNWRSARYTPSVSGSGTPGEGPAVSVAPSELTVDEAGGTAPYVVSLNSRPSGTVTISVSSSDTGAAIVSASSLTFTTGNWNTPRILIVTGVDDDAHNAGDRRTATISHAASGGGYDGVAVDAVTVTVRDDDDPPTVDEPEESTGSGLVISAVPGDPRALDISWDPLGDTFHYRVRATPDGFFETIGRARGTTSLRLSGLQAGTTYTVTVEAFTSDGIVVHATGQGTPCG
ncbi:MAG: fibronectin type III domain-containing protein [Chloroflexi bacterium]|nr:fibronectin type III domain-containing protein [Chloroflexota bacterium]